jgi:hypothetical protein
MKLFQVQYEQDGASYKDGHKSVTDIDRVTMSLCAENIQQVWDALEYIRLDEEKTIMSIAEVLPAVQILK